ncbi:MAG TPA: enoyl-CoA hydratase [Actinomycetota bacterium]
MGYQTLLVERRGAIELVTMNRPEVRNAQNTALIDELDDAMRVADRDPDVRVIVLAGAGDHWSSGHDLKAYVGEAPADEWHEKRLTPEGKFDHERTQYFDKCLAIRDLRTPTIAMVQGHVVAAGWMLAAMCDLIVCADDAVFQNPVARMTAAGVELLAEIELGPRKAKELLFTGDALEAPEAHRLGFVNRVVPRALLEEATFELAEKVARLPAITAQNIKRSVNHAMDLGGYRAALEYHFMVHQFQHNTKTSLDALAARQQKGSMKDVFRDRDAGYES